MQDEDTTQEVRGIIPPPPPHVPMIAPKKHPYRYSSFSNDKKELELDDACLLFTIIKRYLKRPSEKESNPNSRFYEVDYILECTIADVKFDLIKKKYSQNTYLKYLKHLHDIKAVLKVNPNNRKCHKYYVNPEFHHRLQSYNHYGLSQCKIYHTNCRHLWI